MNYTAMAYLCPHKELSSRVTGREILWITSHSVGLEAKEAPWLLLRLQVHIVVGENVDH